MALNVYQMVTDRIIEDLNNNIIPWFKPWVGTTSQPINYVTRKPYKGVNLLLLPEPGEYLTYKQATDCKGNIKKGAKSHLVVYFSMVKGKYTDPATGEEKEELYPLLKYSRVFHIKDTEGIDSKLVNIATNSHDPIQEAEATIEDYLDRESGLGFFNDKESDSAFYNPADDSVTVPMPAQFKSIEEYYSTVFHEFVHSTAKASRCDRPLDTAAFFASETYSREELIAEMGSAMLMNRLGIEIPKTFANSVAYIQNWLAALRNDNKFIIWASSRAEKAVRYITNDNVEAAQNA